MPRVGSRVFSIPRAEGLSLMSADGKVASESLPSTYFTLHVQAGVERRLESCRVRAGRARATGRSSAARPLQPADFALPFARSLLTKNENLRDFLTGASRPLSKDTSRCRTTRSAIP